MKVVGIEAPLQLFWRGRGSHTPLRPSCSDTSMRLSLPLYVRLPISLVGRPKFPERLPEVMPQGTGRLSFHLWTGRRRSFLQLGAGRVDIVEPGRLARAAEVHPPTRRSSYRCLRLPLLPSSSCTSWRGRRLSTVVVGEGGINSSSSSCSSNWWVSRRCNRFTRERNCCHPRVARTSTGCPTNSSSSSNNNRPLLGSLLQQGGLRQLPCQRRHQT